MSRLKYLKSAQRLKMMITTHQIMKMHITSRSLKLTMDIANKFLWKLRTIASTSSCKVLAKRAPVSRTSTATWPSFTADTPRWKDIMRVPSNWLLFPKIMHTQILTTNKDLFSVIMVSSRIRLSLFMISSRIANKYPVEKILDSSLILKSLPLSFQLRWTRIRVLRKLWKL